MRELLAVAEAATGAAGAELVARRGTDLRIETKSSDTDPVSDADRAAEAAAVRVVTAARPDDGVLSEEGIDIPSATGLRWVIDPLDGTVNFLYGLPGWCVSVACEERGTDGTWSAIAACVWDPVHDERFTALRGRGAWCGAEPIAVNDPVPLASALVATGFAYERVVRTRQAATAARVLTAARDLRRIGSAALDLCWLAAGRLDAYWEDSTKRWDWAGGALIAAEAGAQVSVLRAPEGGAGTLAAGPALHAELRELLETSG